MKAQVNIAEQLDIVKKESESASKDHVYVPKNVEIEQAVLGALLHNNENLNKVGDFLLPEHFFIPIHKRIYEAILKLTEKSMIATPLTLKSYFAKDEAFEASGVNCFDYLLKLVTDADLIVDVTSLASAIYDLHLRRELIRTGEDIVLDAYKEDINKSAQDRLEAAEQHLFNLATQGNNERNLIPLSKSLMSTLTHINEIMSGRRKTSGVTTNFEEMDKKTGGLQPSDLIIIAARPSMGKTSFAISIGMNVAANFQKEFESEEKDREKKSKKDGEINKKSKTKPKSVAIFSLEMSSDQIATRILAIESQIDSGRIKNGHLTKEEFAKLSIATAKLNNLPLFIDDTPALKISAIRTRARRMKRQNNLGLIIVDYLQLINPSIQNNNTNRVQEIGEISQGLKALAKELNIPVIALSQLSRAVETREDKRPQLSDLRESGNIEQDADVVMFLYRKEYYLKRKTPIDEKKNMDWQMELNEVRNTAEIIISKQRNGPIGTFWLYFDNNTTGFKNLDMQHHTSHDD